ncbi:MAG: hypothetical protein M3Y72_24475 [Acidobacteriota bacterium]|nr:hypothetical protein [Acidobacteriota bacterium]
MKNSLYSAAAGQGAQNAALAPHPCTLQSSCRRSFAAVRSATLQECHPTPQRFQNAWMGAAPWWGGL